MATIKILRRNKPTSADVYPIVLRITKDRKSKLISLKINCNLKDWDEKNQQLKKSYLQYVQTNNLLSQLKNKAMDIIFEFRREEFDFTLDQFEEKFRGKKYKNQTVSEFWLEKIADLITAGRTGNARANKDTYDSFFKFQKSKSLLFREVTPRLLDKYETFLRSRENTSGGIGVKMRALRAVFNDAIKKGVVGGKYYPFNAYKVSKHKSNNIKKALSLEEINLIREFDILQYPHMTDSINYFMFSYYARGINFVDMLKLEWTNIVGDRIDYVRSKTKDQFSIEITEPLSEILSFYKSQNRNTNFVFPILLKENLTPIQIEKQKGNALNKYNKQLKKITKILNIEQKITSYSARHSYATNLKFKGVSTDVISQSMGHKDVSTTSTYLKDFETELIDIENRKLLEEEELNYAS